MITARQRTMGMSTISGRACRSRSSGPGARHRRGAGSDAPAAAHAFGSASTSDGNPGFSVMDSSRRPSPRFYRCRMVTRDENGSDGCYSCEQNAALAGLPTRERIHVSGGWRVAHAIRCAMPGWLVLVARRHITTIAELDDAEAAELGPLCQRLSRGLVEVTGCTRTYVAAFSEAAGFTHLHVHVIPRAGGLPADQLGPAVFSYLRRPPTEWVSPEVMDSLSRSLASRLAPAL